MEKLAYVAKKFNTVFNTDTTDFDIYVGSMSEPEDE